MLALCSDLDETPDRHVYGLITRYLNTTDETPMGPGVGLEVGNSIYFDMPGDQFAYWNTDDAGRATVQALIRSGHVDCLHSFGDLATSRAHAGRALDELSRHGCRVAVWVDHAVAPSNFGADIMRGEGDLAGAAAYHADLTCGFGVRYVWRGRVTSVIGQDARRSLRGIFRRHHPLASAKTLAKEAAKGVLARAGSGKYAMHGSNALLRPVSLRSGHAVWEFLRSNPYWAGVDRGETAEGLGHVLNASMLRRLEARGGYCALYTHLGKVRRTDEPFPPHTRAALAALSAASRAGRVLVTTTRRMLDHAMAVRHVSATASDPGNGALVVDVTTNGAGDLGSLEGLSLYVPTPERTTVRVNGREVGDLQRNPPDHTGRASVSIPWRPLEFPRP
jgi:hypothetical protein